VKKKVKKKDVSKPNPIFQTRDQKVNKIPINKMLRDEIKKESSNKKN